MSIPQTTAQNSFIGRKLALSFGLIVASSAYVVWQHLGTTASLAVTTPTVPNETTSTQITPTVAPAVLAPVPVTPTKAPVPVPTPAPTPIPQKPAGLYTNGSYTGSAIDAYYGIVQVKAIVKNGQLADVQWLQYPSDRNTSREISSQAMPLLTQEALQAQSAQVDGVSGATQTSEGFIRSLTSALTQAKA